MPRPHEAAAGNTMLMNTGLQKAGACSGEGQILKLPIDNQLAQRVERKADSAITLSEFLSDSPSSRWRLAQTSVVTVDELIFSL